MIVYQMLYNVIWFTTCRSIPKQDYYFATIYTTVVVYHTLVYYPTLLHNVLDSLSTPSIQNKTSHHTTLAKQYFLYHSKPTYNLTLYQTTHPQLLPIPLDSTAKPCYTTNQTSVRCLADFQHLQLLHKLKYKLNKLIHSNHTRSSYQTYINTYKSITRQYISYYHAKLDPNYNNYIITYTTITYNYIPCTRTTPPINILHIHYTI